MDSGGGGGGGGGGGVGAYNGTEYADSYSLLKVYMHSLVVVSSMFLIRQ